MSVSVRTRSMAESAYRPIGAFDARTTEISIKVKEIHKLHNTPMIAGLHHIARITSTTQADKLFMAALCNRGAIIFLPCSFYLLSSSFFPRLISAAADWMSTILLHMEWP